MAIGMVKTTRKPLYCSFCGKEQDEVGYLIAGPTVFICNECVELCREIGQEMLCERPRNVVKLRAPASPDTERKGG